MSNAQTKTMLGLKPPIQRPTLKHQELRSRLLGEIAIGRFRPGDILPSENQLTEIMSVSRTTVRQTLGDLEREGIVRRVQGKGTFVAERTKPETTTRTAPLGLVIPEVSTGYYPTLISGFERSSQEVGRPIVVCNSKNDVDKQASQLMCLIDQHIAGVLLNPSTNTVTPSYQVRLVQDANIPVVLLHRGIPEVKAPVLLLPGEEIGRRAARLLLDAHHRRVAFLASQRYEFPESMEKGFREVLSEAGVDLPVEWTDYGTMQTYTAEDFHSYELHLEQLLVKLFNEPAPPTAMFVSFDAPAELIYLIAGRLGLKVPDDLSIVCFGGAHRKGAIMRRLTAVTVDEAEAAQQAVDLFNLMHSGQLPICTEKTISMQLGLSEGQTLMRRGE